MFKTLALMLSLLLAAETNFVEAGRQLPAKKAVDKGPPQGQVHGNHGPPFGRGQGRGAAGDPTFAQDHATIFFLLQHRNEVTRKVTLRKDGVETVTESTNPEVAAKIREHVAAMYKRVDQTRPIHMRDPLFREIFRNTDQIDMKMANTDRGIRVIETSKDARVARLIQEHAKVVSLFLKNGHAEVRKNHAVPPAE